MEKYFPRRGKTDYSIGMRITFLGTGTSYGIPMPGCDCAICRSPDPRDQRLRTAILVEAAKTHLLLDTPPDLRTQCLRYNIRQIDGVLMTHAHADHMFGFDDLRPFTNRMPEPMPVWCSEGTAKILRRIFDYLDHPPLPGTSLARINLHTVTGPFDFRGIRLTPLPAEHGRADMIGWKIEHDGQSFVAIPDCKHLPENTLELCRGVDVAVVDALRVRPHPTHMNFEEAIAVLRQIGARRSLVIHLCHEVSHAQAESLLPAGMEPAHDGLQIAWDANHSP
jgi:phosphoribosyl 1,2-cyclic phosphate phosphodiesterase